MWERFPSHLKSELQRGNCVLFVGAGLSAQVHRSDGRPLPTWSQLLVELLDLADHDGLLECGQERIQKQLQEGDLLGAAQQLQDGIPSARLAGYFEGIFGDPGVAPSHNHRLIPRTPLRAVLTTNYDRLIEGAYTLSQQGREPMCFTQEDLIRRPDPLRNYPFFIFKLHGDYLRIETVVLGSRDYHRLFFRRPRYRYLLERVFAGHTVVFVGFGGRDPDIDGILNKLMEMFGPGQYPHYIILPSQEADPTRRREFQEKGLRILEYDARDNHRELTELLASLACGQSQARPVLVCAASDCGRMPERVEEIIKRTGLGCSFLDVPAAISRNWLAVAQQEVNATAGVVLLISGKSWAQQCLVASLALSTGRWIIPLLLVGARLPRMYADLGIEYVCVQPSDPDAWSEGLATQLRAVIRERRLG